MSSLRLLGICGSLRAGSWNRKLMLEAARLFDPAEFTDGNLRLPLYDGDLEAEGIPPEVQTLADQIKSADAVVIVGPEYNKALSGVLKNALDWVSRVPGGVWRDKPVAILSAAAGRAGGERSQMTMRHAMNPFRAHVLPGPEVMIAAPDREFDAAGRLVNEAPIRLLTELMGDLRKAAGG
jgi:chromate reductase, NAD(P)H dehydrogenase (quinone)